MRARRVTTSIVAASVSKLYRVFGTFMEPPSLLGHRGKDWVSTLSPRITCTLNGAGAGGGAGLATTTRGAAADTTGAVPKNMVEP